MCCTHLLLITSVQVVETIGFEDDDDDALPAPQDLPSEPMEKQKTEKEIGSVKQSAPHEDAPRTQGPTPPQGPAQPTGAAYPPLEEANDDTAVVEEETFAGPQLAPVPERLIRKDYVPQIGTKLPGSVHYALDPLTGQQVSAWKLEITYAENQFLEVPGSISSSMSTNACIISPIVGIHEVHSMMSPK